MKLNAGFFHLQLGNNSERREQSNLNNHIQCSSSARHHISGAECMRVLGIISCLHSLVDFVRWQLKHLWQNKPKIQRAL
jgi:hypothetical protein